LTAVTSGNVSVTAGAATQLAITTQPSTRVASGGNLGTPVIIIRDAQGNVVTTDNRTEVMVTVSNGGTLGGTTTETASNGAATFGALTLAGTAGKDYILTFTSSNLTGATSGNVSVTLTITSQPETTATENQLYSYKITTNDADGDKVTLTATTKPDWLAFDPSTGELRGTPVHGDVGDHEVVITATDDDGKSATQSFTITVADVNVSDVNNTPTIVDQNFEVKENTTYVGPVIAKDDDDILTYSIVEEGDSTYFDIGPYTGLLTFKPPYKPDYEEKKQYIFQVRVTDSAEEPLSSTAKITVNVINVNEPPKAYDQEIYVLEQEYTIVNLSASDPEDKPVNYKVNSLPGQGNLKNGDDLITEAPFYVDNDSNLEYQSTKAATEFDSFTFTASDGESESNISVVRINIEQVNDPGSVQIIGSTIIDGTLTAEVMDNDGVDESRVSYQWYLIGDNDADNLVRREIAGANQKTLKVIDRWEGQRIGVEVIYEDQQGHQNTVYAQTERTVTAMPIYKKTIKIDEVYPNEVLMSAEDLKEEFGVTEMNGISLKDLSPEAIQNYYMAKLPAERQPWPANYRNVIPQPNIEYLNEAHGALKDLEMIGKKDGGIVLKKKPVLKESYIVDTAGKGPIGEVYTIGVFKNQKILGVIHIRIRPSHIRTDVCPDNFDKQRPILVFIPGWGGTGTPAMIALEYFNNLPEIYTEAGFVVFVYTSPPYATSLTRSQPTIEYVECLLFKSQQDTVIIVGHSMGATTAAWTAFYLDKHPGYNPNNGITAVKAVLSLTGAIRGGLLLLRDQSHLRIVTDKLEQMYQLQMIVGDLSAGMVTMKFVNEALKNDSIKKQFDKYKNFLDEFTEEKTLPKRLEEINDKLLPVFDKIAQDIGKIKNSSSSFLSNWGWALDMLLGYHVKIKDSMHALVAKIHDLDIDAKDLAEKSKRVEPHAKKIVELVKPIHDKLIKLPDSNKNKNLNALVEEIEQLYEEIEQIKDPLLALQWEFEKDFLPELENVVGEFGHLRHIFTNNCPNFLLFFPCREVLPNFIGLSYEEIDQFRYALDQFVRLAKNALVIIGRWQDIDLDLDKLIRDLDNKQLRDANFEKITKLLNQSEIFLSTVIKTIDNNKDKLRDLTLLKLELDPSKTLEKVFWGKFNEIGHSYVPVSLADVRDALTDVEQALIDIRKYVLKTKAFIATRLHLPADEDWDQIYTASSEKIPEILEGLIFKLLDNEEVAKQGLGPAEFTQCFQKLNEYVQSQEYAQIGQLPTKDELPVWCTNVIIFLMSGIIDWLLPMDDVNEKTGVLRKVEAQHSFTLLPILAMVDNWLMNFFGTDKELYERCYNTGEIASVKVFPSATGFYYVAARRKFDPDDLLDNIMTNLVYNFANNNEKSKSPSPIHLLAGATLNRSGGYSPEGDLTPRQKYQIKIRSDLNVPVCNQITQKHLKIDEINAINANHLGIITQTGRPKDDVGKVMQDLLIGKAVPNFEDTEPYIKKCNNQPTIEARNDCTADLFIRILLMHGIYTANELLQKNDEGRLNLFVVLMAFLTDKVELQETKQLDLEGFHKDLANKLMQQTQ
jgi:pimeloyl-ACP methyl ester carboxylesterase